MLPGAAPPVKEPEPLEIGFDVPAEAKTLTSANKVRDLGSYRNHTVTFLKRKNILNIDQRMFINLPMLI